MQVRKKKTGIPGVKKKKAAKTQTIHQLNSRKIKVLQASTRSVVVVLVVVVVVEVFQARNP